MNNKVKIKKSIFDQLPAINEQDEEHEENSEQSSLSSAKLRVK